MKQLASICCSFAQPCSASYVQALLTTAFAWLHLRGNKFFKWFNLCMYQSTTVQYHAPFATLKHFLGLFQDKPQFSVLATYLSSTIDLLAFCDNSRDMCCNQLVNHSCGLQDD